MAKFISRDTVAQRERLNELAKQRATNLGSEVLEPLEVPGITPYEADFRLCEHGVNIVQINLASTGSDDFAYTRYSVSFEFLVTYKDSTTRWAKDVIITADDPNGEEFRGALLNYTKAVRRRMQTVELRCD